MAFCARMGYFWVWNFVTICFVVYSYSTTTIVFLFFFNSDIWICVDFGVVVNFWDSNGLLFWWWWFSKLVCGSPIKLHFSFSLLPLIVTFVFDLNLGYFGLFLRPKGSIFCSQGKVHKLFWGLFILLNNFYFLCFLQFWLFILT